MGLSDILCWKQLPAAAGNEVDENGESEPEY